ncbi:HAD-IIIA family hydrolase [bacterium]|nr:HAD-IIIA family hydrolase [bacterium]
MKLVILGRDGVINEVVDGGVAEPKQLRFIPGALEAIARMNHNDVRVCLATNQPGVGEGRFDYDALFAVHESIAKALHKVGGHIDAIAFCPHADNEGCDCRKPRSGLFKELSRRLQHSLDGVPAVGHNLVDIQAAAAAGAKPVLLRTGGGQAALADDHADLKQAKVYDDLAAFADMLIA